MESVLFPIHAEHCDYIAQGIKEWEFRTKPPKIETPYKGFIYETKGRRIVRCSASQIIYFGRGKVIGEFICDKMVEVVRNGFVNPFAINSQVLEKGHLSNNEFLSYTDHYRKDLYALHISQLVIYDKPKDLTEFRKPRKRANCGCKDCASYYNKQCRWDGGGCDKLIIRKAPQSWCFAEKL